MNRSLLCALGLGSLLLGGCVGGGGGDSSSNIPLPEAPGDGWIRNPLEDTAIFLATNNDLAKLVDIQNLIAYSTRQGGLKATCHLKNLTPQPLPIQLRAIFRKADGTTLEESAWQSVTLPVNKYVPFEVVNESGNASRVLIEMRVKDLKGAAPIAPPPPGVAPIPAAG